MPDRSLRGLRRGVLFALAALWGACAPPEPRPLHVEYAGCAEVFLPGPVCALGKRSRQMRLWVDQPPQVEVAVRADGRPLEGTRVAVAGGQRLVVEIPSGASAVEVRARTSQGEAAWSLVVTAAHWPPSVREAHRLWKEKGPADALRLLEGQIPRLSRGERWLALRLRAEIVLDQDLEASGEVVELFEEAVAAERAAGALLAEAKEATTLAWIHIQERRFAAARKVLSDLRLPDGSPAEAVYDRSFHLGLLAEDSGDARSALAQLEQAVEQAKRVGLETERWAAEHVLARQHQGLGRSREAAALFAGLRRSRPAGLSSCDWAEMLTNQAWSLLLAREAGEKLGDPIPVLVEAQESFERAGCRWPEERRLNHQLNVALAHLQDGRPAAARASLAQAHALDRFATPLQRLWSLELAARLELAEGRPQAALALFERLEELAASALSPDGRWRAAYGQARCYRALGRSADALAAFRKAESLLDERSLQIPVQEGRDTFAAQHEGATELHLELLLASGRDAGAFDVARRARSRVLRQLARGNRLAHLSPGDQQIFNGAMDEYWRHRQSLDADVADDWKLPADQLDRLRAAREVRYRDAERALDRALTVLGEAGGPESLAPPRPGEVVLAYHPLPAGWVGFAASGETVEAHRFELPEAVLARPAELGERLLAPFGPQIERAGRVRVLPYGDLREVDFHALPFGGDVLLAARPVVYGLDLAVGESRPPSSPTGGRRVLIVANPRGDLPAAEVEAGQVTAALRRQRPAWSAAVLSGTAASAEAVRSGLARADLLHYAGHGTFSGFGGWRSDLPLAGGSRLALGDVLALERVPPRVVLSACEAARAGGEAPAEGLSLAHAFLLAGSRSVVAATRPVGDRAAQGLFADLYRRWGSTPDLAVLLRQAQLAWRRQDPGADWPSFRLFEP